MPLAKKMSGFGRVLIRKIKFTLTKYLKKTINKYSKIIEDTLLKVINQEATEETTLS